MNLNYSMDVHFTFSIGSKATRDKVNQIAHVRKARGSLGTKNMAVNRDIVRVLKRAVIFSVDWSIPVHLKC